MSVMGIHANPYHFFLTVRIKTRDIRLVSFSFLVGTQCIKLDVYFTKKKSGCMNAKEHEEPWSDKSITNGEPIDYYPAVVISCSVVSQRHIFL